MQQKQEQQEKQQQPQQQQQRSQQQQQLLQQQQQQQCQYCLGQLQSPFVVCAVCTGLRLCRRCFALGAEGGKHQRSHDYVIGTLHDWQRRTLFRDPGSPPGSWTLEMETRLLDSIDVFGMGNWADVALKVKGQSSEACLRHYQRHYLLGAVGRLCVAPAGVEDSASVEDLTTDEPSSPEEAANVRLTQEEAQALGFLPLRDEFEREYDNDAEAVLCQLQPSFEEDALDNALKLAHIDMYRGRLAERARRRRLARRHGLLSGTVLQSLCGAQPQAADDRRPRDCDALAVDKRLRPFLRFLRRDDCRRCLRALATEAELRADLRRLLRLRRMGMRRLPASDPGGQLSDTKPFTHADANGDSSGGNGENSLLSEAERQLCERLRLSADAYLVAKLCVLARQSAGACPPALAPLCEFFRSQGWLA